MTLWKLRGRKNDYIHATNASRSQFSAESIRSDSTHLTRHMHFWHTFQTCPIITCNGTIFTIHWIGVACVHWRVDTTYDFSNLGILLRHVWVCVRTAYCNGIFRWRTMFAWMNKPHANVCTHQCRSSNSILICIFIVIFTCKYCRFCASISYLYLSTFRRWVAVLVLRFPLFEYLKSHVVCMLFYPLQSSIRYCGCRFLLFVNGSAIMSNRKQQNNSNIWWNLDWVQGLNSSVERNCAHCIYCVYMENGVAALIAICPNSGWFHFCPFDNILYE